MHAVYPAPPKRLLTKHVDESSKISAQGISLEGGHNSYDPFVDEEVLGGYRVLRGRGSEFGRINAF